MTAIYKFLPNGKGGYSLKVNHAIISGKNFSGRPQGEFKSTTRCVNLQIDNEEVYARLKADHWRFWTPRIDPESKDSDYYEPFSEDAKGNLVLPRTSLVLGFKGDWRDPKVTMRTNTKRGETVLTEETVGELDYSNISRCDLVINPWTSDKGNTTGYIQNMKVMVEDDPLADDWDDLDEEDELVTDMEDDVVPFA